MFTGLIETVGIIAELQSRGEYRVLHIEVPEKFGPPVLGESVSCDGACLTVSETGENYFVVEASQETISKTILPSYSVGSRINLERALKADSRLGGHFVTGHIDGEPGEGPMKVGPSIVDYMTGMNTSIGILAALYHRKANGGAGLSVARPPAVSLDVVAERYARATAGIGTDQLWTMLRQYGAARSLLT